MSLWWESMWIWMMSWMYANRVCKYESMLWIYDDKEVIVMIQYVCEYEWCRMYENRVCEYGWMISWVYKRLRTKVFIVTCTPREKNIFTTFWQLQRVFVLKRMTTAFFLEIQRKHAAKWKNCYSTLHNTCKNKIPSHLLWNIEKNMKQNKIYATSFLVMKWKSW